MPMDMERMEALRKKLDYMMGLEDIDRDELQKLSEELDILIVEFLKKQLGDMNN